VDSPDPDRGTLDLLLGRAELAAEGEPETAVELYRALVEQAERHHFSRHVGEANLGLAGIYGRLDPVDVTGSGAADRVQLFGERALRAFQVAGDAAGQLRALTTLALHHALRRDLKHARFYVSRMRRLEAPGRDWWVHYVEGVLASRVGDHAASAELFERCLGLSASLPAGRRDYFERQCRRQLAAAHMELGRFDEALPQFERVLAEARVAEEWAETSRCGLAIALIHAIRQDWQAVQEALGSAVQYTERLRSGVGSPTNQRGISEAAAPVYTMLVTALLRQEAASSALGVLELSRARAVLHQFTSAAAWQAAPPPDEMRRRYALEEERELDCLADVGDPPDPALVDRWKGALRTRRRLLHQMEETVYAGAGLGADAFPTASVSRIVDLVPADHAVVAYYVGAEVHAFVVTRAGVRHVPTGECADRVRDVGAVYRREMAAAAAHGDFPAVSPALADAEAALHAALVAPVARHLTGRRVILVPSKELWDVPLHAVGGERALTASHEVAYSFSLSVLARLLARESRAPSRPFFVGIADPDRSLPGAEQEVQASAGFFPERRVLTGEAARRDAVLDALPEATVVHVACHGVFLDDFPEFSYLKLAGRGVEARLDVAAIARTPLTAELVVLSACHSGRGGSYSGDEFVGFPTAFLASGAACVLGSLWSIDDAATVRFLQHFYAAARRGSIGTAFQSAQRHLAETPEFSHPYFWAAFQLYGALG
jgi:tetratricopeptide (TPR) repeat protein